MDDFPWFIFLFPIMLICWIMVIHGMSSRDEIEYHIPMCDESMHGSHWEIWTSDANRYGNEITQAYLEHGWHNITVEIHNNGVSDRVNAECL